MKPFAILTLTLVLTAAMLVGCGCTNQNMDPTTMPTVLPTNEEIWNSTETTTHSTTEAATIPTTAGSTVTETTGETTGVNETEVQNHVNAQQDLNEKIRDNQQTGRASENGADARRMMPGNR